MKLWQKIFLCTLALVMAAIGITSVLLVKNNYTLLMDQQMKNNQFQHRYLASNIKTKLMAERLRKNVIVLKDEEILKVIKGIFQEQDDINTPKVSFCNEMGNVFYQNITTSSDKDLCKLVKESGKICIQTKEEKGKVLLLVASKIKMENAEYIFITYHNITQIYRIHKEQVVYIQNISIASAAVISIFLLILVKILLLPLKKINKVTEAIAEGEYHKRMKIKGHSELSKLAQNTNHMAEAVETNVTALQAVAENRKQFIANLSHEMKTPLTSIVGFTDIIRIKKDITKEELEEYGGIIAEEAKRLRTLSGKLMELITVGETNLDWKMLSIRQIVEEMKLTLEPILEKAKIQLDYSCEEGELVIDKELFKSLFYNIIDNAIKACHEGGQIKIEGTFEKDTLIMKVKDDGIGIERKQLDKITEPFYMVDKARTRANGGAGLGLGLCMEIAKVHQGILKVESQLEVGTCITIIMKGGNCNEG